MPGISDLEAVVAKLEQATEDARGVIREGHAMTKDLRGVIREAKHLLDGDAVNERIDAQVAAGLERYVKTIVDAQAEATERVANTFNELAEIFLGSKLPDGGLLAFVDARAAERGALELKKRLGSL